MKCAVITTTINVPIVLSKYAAALQREQKVYDWDWRIFIAGDKNSPHGDIQDWILEHGADQMTYLLPHDQDRWASSEVIGWKCIQRRNIALLEAIEWGADVIVTIDDDNIPMGTSHFGPFHLLDRPWSGRTYSNPHGWFNPCSVMGQLGEERIWHRGFPHSQRRAGTSIGDTVGAETDLHIGVMAGFWFGDPDIDAIDRVIYPHKINHLRPDAEMGFVLDIGTWAPFNSQNTGYTRRLAPLMMCWPGVGRFDDIWASYLARAVMDTMNIHVHYGSPVVVQERNSHNVYKDIHDELLGYEKTDELCDAIRNVLPPHKRLTDPDLLEPIEMLPSLYGKLDRLDWLPGQTKESFDAWLIDLNTIEKETN